MGAGKIGLGKQQAELLASESARYVGGAQVRPDRLAERAEVPVACKMAVDIVDPLETVEIEHQDRKGGAIAARAKQLVLQPLEEILALIEPGQLIACRPLVVPSILDRHAGLQREGRQDGQGVLVVSVLPVRLHAEEADDHSFDPQRRGHEGPHPRGPDDGPQGPGHGLLSQVPDEKRAEAAQHPARELCGGNLRDLLGRP